MPDTLVRDLTEGELLGAAGVLGRGMRDNPLHLRVFGPDPGGRELALTRLFGAVLPRAHRKGRVLGAFHEAQLVGVCAVVAPGHCRLSIGEKARVAPRMLRSMSLNRVLSLVRWTNGWERLDPSSAHWHIGPVGVERHLQGRGIGSAIMRAVLDPVREAPAYLETDKLENVRFYERFAFTVRLQSPVLGMPNWFIQRDGDSHLTCA